MTPAHKAKVGKWTDRQEAVFWRMCFIALGFSMIWKYWWLQMLNFLITMLLWHYGKTHPTPDAGGERG